MTLVFIRNEVCHTVSFHKIACSVQNYKRLVILIKKNTNVYFTWVPRGVMHGCCLPNCAP